MARQHIFAIFAAAAAVGMVASGPVAAKDKDESFVIVNEDIGLPVFPYDITDRPYEVIGEIETDVRKATIFSKAPSQEKIYKELWERGEKMGADAVINAEYGNARVTLMSWGASKATGTAIRFVEAPPPPEEPVEAEAAAEAEVEADVDMAAETEAEVEVATDAVMEEAVEETVAE